MPHWYRGMTRSQLHSAPTCLLTYLITNSALPSSTDTSCAHTWSWYGATTPMLFALKLPHVSGQLAFSSHNLSTTSNTYRPTRPTIFRLTTILSWLRSQLHRHLPQHTAHKTITYKIARRNVPNCHNRRNLVNIGTTLGFSLWVLKSPQKEHQSNIIVSVIFSNILLQFKAISALKQCRC